MIVDGKNLQPIWFDDASGQVHVIDQRLLPHRFETRVLHSPQDARQAIADMVVRGAPLIGATGAWGVYLAVHQAKPDRLSSDALSAVCEQIKSARPTAVNLAWAVDQVATAVAKAADDPFEQFSAARQCAADITASEAARCRAIGRHGVALIAEISQRKPGQPVNVLTHCNAGWLACVDYGTATAPIYAAARQGIAVHVWVDETRPLNQGSRLTAWELGACNIAHTIITDNAGGHLMQHGQVDLVIVGSDRTTATGDVANKVGTYLKALAARDNQVPFYVALPSTTIDWRMTDGLRQIPIEQRDPEEVCLVQGLDEEGALRQVRVPPLGSPALNIAFDVTPARLITGLITEKGICAASASGIQSLFADAD